MLFNARDTMHKGENRIGRATGEYASSRRNPLAAAAWAIVLGGGLGVWALGGCNGPRYPSCDNDQQCSTEGHKGVCVNHLCTECRDNAGCPEGQECTNGACGAPEGSCTDDKGCPSGQGCGDDKKCHATPKASVECDDSHACVGSAHCENGHCVTPPQGGPGCTDFPAPKFEYESPELSAQARSTLERLAKCITSGSLKGARVLFTGHCDARGENEFNLGLGAQRAENVKTFAVGLGLPAEKIQTSSRGKLDANGTDEAGWANDRRVDIEVR